MGTSMDRPPATPLLKGIVNERESQLRLVTSVRLRWMAVLGQLAAIAAVTLLYGFPLNIGSCLVLIAMSAWLNVFLVIRYPARHRLTTPFAFALLVYDRAAARGTSVFDGGHSEPVRGSAGRADHGCLGDAAAAIHALSRRHGHRRGHAARQPSLSAALVRRHALRASARL